MNEIEEEKYVIKKDDTQNDAENNSRIINDNYFDDNKNEIKTYNSINTDLENLDIFFNQIENKSENNYKINDNDLFSISEENSKDNNKDSNSENNKKKQLNIENIKTERGVLLLFSLYFPDNNFKDCLRNLLLSNEYNELESIENRLDDMNIDYKAKSKEIKYSKKNVKLKCLNKKIIYKLLKLYFNFLFYILFNLSFTHL